MSVHLSSNLLLVTNVIFHVLHNFNGYFTLSPHKIKIVQVIQFLRHISFHLPTEKLKPYNPSPYIFKICCLRHLLSKYPLSSILNINLYKLNVTKVRTALNRFTQFPQKSLNTSGEHCTIVESIMYRIWESLTRNYSNFQLKPLNCCLLFGLKYSSWFVWTSYYGTKWTVSRVTTLGFVKLLPLDFLLLF